MNVTLDRRQVLSKTSALAACTATSSTLPWGAFASAADLKGITVTHFGGPYQAIKDLVGDPFEKAGKGKVVYETENSVSALSKIQTQPDNPPFNVVMFARSFTIRAGNAGFLRPIQSGEIPAVAELVNGAVAPGNYGVAMFVEGIGIMYDKSKVERPIESWLDLWRSDLVGKIAVPSASLPTYFVVMAIARALTGTDTTPESINAAFSKLAELKKSVRVWYGDPTVANQLMERGDIVAAVQFGGRMSQVFKTTPKVQRAILKEGIPGFPIDVSITSKSNDQSVSLEYINFSLTAAVQQQLATRILIGSSNKSVRIPDDLKPLIMDPGEIWFPDEVYAAKQTADWARRWQREVQG